MVQNKNLPHVYTLQYSMVWSYLGEHSLPVSTKVTENEERLGLTS